MNLSKLFIAFALIAGINTTVNAQKFSYEFTVSAITFNGDLLKLSQDVVKSGTVKKSSKRLPIATLNDGSTLHAEIVITTEGVMLDKYTVVQVKYYTRKNNQWTLFCVSQRRKFKDEHFDKGTFTYNDPQTNESLSIEYLLILKK